MSLNLAQRITVLSDALHRSGLNFAFGGAIALAFCVGDDFHRQQAARIRHVPFAGGTIPVLAPESLAVFKAMFNRPKVWIDLAEMIKFSGTDWTFVATALIELVGDEDPRTMRLRSLLTEVEPRS